MKRKTANRKWPDIRSRRKRLPLIHQPWFIFAAASTAFLLLGIGFLDDLPVSESVYFWDKAQNWQRALTIVWHPPVYSFLLSLFVGVFQGAFSGGYLLGLLSVILSAGLIYALIREQAGPAPLSPSALWPLLAAYYTLPLILQGAFVYDIDNTLLTPALLAVYLSYLRFLHRADGRRAVVFFLALSLSFWIKMTTPFLLLGAIGLYHALRWQLRWLFTRLLPILAAAVGLFYLTYGWWYTEWMLDGYGSFQFSGGKAWGLIMGQHTFQLSLKELAFSIASNAGALAAWTSPLFCGLVPVWLWLWRRQPPSSSRSQTVERGQPYHLVPLLFILITLISYTLILKIQASAGFPKYHYPLFAFFLVLLGTTLRRADLSFNRWDLIILIGLVGLFALIIRDHLLHFYVLGRSRRLGDLTIYFLQLSLWIAVPCGLYLLYRGEAIRKNPANLLLLVLTLSVTVNLAGFLWRSGADYSTNYHYGIRGTAQVLAYTKDIPADQSVYLPFAGYFIEPQGPGERSEYGRLLGADPYRPLTDYLIMTDYLLNSGTYFFGVDWVETHYLKLQTIHDYSVWKRKPIPE